MVATDRMIPLRRTEERDALIRYVGKLIGSESDAFIIDWALGYAKSHLPTQESNDMFELQVVNRAYGPGDVIPWEAARRERFSSLNAAKAALRDEQDAMRARCGASGWDGHFRLIALQDTTAEAEFACSGPIGAEQPGGCQHYRSVLFTWKAGHTYAECVPDSPDGWYSAVLCPVCRAAEIEARVAETG